MTSIVGGGGSNANFQVYDDVQLQQATKTLEQQPTDTIDSIATTKSLDAAYVDTYVNPPGKAELPPPTSSQATTMDQMLNGLRSLQSQKKSILENMQGQAAQKMNDQKVYNDAVQAQVETLSDAQLQEIAYQPGMTPEAIKEEVYYAIFHPDVDVPDSVRSLASQISSSALTTAQETLGADWTPADMAWAQDAGIMMAMQGLFQDAISETPGLSKDDIAQLHFAMENPDAVSSLSPRLQAIFNQVMGKVTTQAQMQYGIPEGWQFPGDDNPNIGPSASFDREFHHAIGALVDKGKISETEARQLEALHYNPDANFPNAASLKETLGKIEGKILKDLQGKWGFPPGYRPATDSAHHESMLNLVYQGVFNQMLESYSPPLTSEQKAAIRAAQASPDGIAGLPPPLQKVAEKIKNMSVHATIEAWGLPTDWSPKIGAIANLSEMEIGFPLLKGFMKNASEILAIGKKTASALPEGEVKNTYMLFLSMVGSVLSRLAEILTQTQIAQAGLGKISSQMRLDLQLNKIKKQQRQLEEMRKQQEKAQKGGLGGFLMNCLTWTINIVIIVCTGGAALALVIYAAAEGRDMMSLNLINYTFEKANQILGKPLGSWAVIIGYVALVAMLVVYSIATFGVGSVYLVAVLAIVVADAYIGNGDIFTNLFIAMGIPETGAMVMSMILCIVVSVIIDVIISIVIEVFTAGMGTELTVALWTAKIGMYAAKIAKTVATVVMTAVRAVMTAIKAMGMIGKMIAKAIQIMAKMVMKLVELTAKVAKAILNAASKLAQKMSQAAAKISQQTAKISTKISGEIMETAIAQNIKNAGRAFATKVDDIGKAAANQKVVKKIIDASKRVKLDKFVNWAAKGFKKQLNDSLSNWDMAKELQLYFDDLADTFASLERGVTKVGDDLADAKKISQETDSILSGAKKAWDGSMTATQKADSLDALRSQAQEIVRAQDALKDAQTALENAKKARVGDLTPFEQQVTQAQKVVRDEQKAIKSLMRNVDKYDAVKELQTTIDNLKKAEKAQGSAEEINELQTRMKAAINMVEPYDSRLSGQARTWNNLRQAEKEFDLAKDEYKAVKSIGRSGFDDEATYAAEKTSAKARRDIADTELDRALAEFEDTFDKSYLEYIQRAQHVTRNGMAAVQAIDGVRLNILQGQIAQMKAEMDAYATEIEYMLKLLKDTIQRLQESVSALGEDIANIGKEIQQLYRSNSQTMTQLSMVA